MKNKNVFALVSISLICLNFIAIPSQSTATTYQLGFDEGDSITWEIIIVNLAQIQNLVDFENYGSNMLNYEVGDKWKWTINSISIRTEEDGLSHWLIEYDFYSADAGESLSYQDEYFRRISRAPADLATDWFTHKDFNFSVVHIPKDPQSYLQDFYNAIPAINQSEYPISGLQYIKDGTAVGDKDKVILKYNNEGIQIEYEVYYDGTIAYKYKMTDHSQDEFNPIIIYGIVGVIAMIAIFGAISAKRRMDLARSSQKIYHEPNESEYRVSREVPEPRHEQVTPGYRVTRATPTPSKNTAPSPTVVTEAKIVGSCDLCGSKRESDALFCPNCGSKFQTE